MSSITKPGYRALLSFVICLFAVQIICVSAADEDNTLHDDTSLLTSSEILLKLYDETRGLRWGKHSNWLQNTDVCTWYGVTCYEEGSTSDKRRVGHVQKLDLSANSLLGTVPPEVFQLPYIESIDIRDNPDVSMSFVGIADAQYLKEIAISNTNVQSLEGIQAAPQLEKLHMTSLGMSDSIPTQIFQLSSLTGLYANYNKFSGSIPSEIGNLKKLVELYLFGSDLTDQIPSELGLLTKLEVVTLAENAFSGTLPSELNSLTLLRTLAINRAFGIEKGSGISGSLPSFSQLKQITDLRLQNQRLSGQIPSEFLMNAPKQEIIKVELTGNSITGTVPPSLSNLKRLNLFLADNQISSVPICDSNDAGIDEWVGGNVGVFGCDGFLCKPGSSAPLGRATTDNACVTCDSATNWGSTLCASSPTTTSTGHSEREVLINLYNKMGGRYWKKDDGWLNPAIDICEWYGVECSDGKVTGLLLKNNDLSDSPPGELFSLPELALIDFESNAINFQFKGIGKATKLESLLLTSCDLTTLDGIGELSDTMIRRLYLSSNSLTGTLPEELASLASLTELDISHNRLQGPIPDSIFGALTNLESLDLAKNNLSNMPTTIGQLTRLKALDVSRNALSGPLPTTIGQLTRLEKLSLHQNALTGPLPAFQNLGLLTSLQLDSNSLEGNLPGDFLRNTQKGDVEIEIRLNDNNLQGEIPEAWSSRFQNLFLDLSGNMISGIDSSLCSKNEWNQGSVGSFSCDAILCPPNTFNELGRQTGPEAVCRSCSNPSSVQHYGAKTCDDSANNAIQEDSEMGPLKKFFDSTNGNNWKNSAGWLLSNNPCENWYGVECDTDGKVVAIELESNGLTGTPSTDVFKLTMLRHLNLKDNQLVFSFEGISQASSLSVLMLSGTGLSSVEGISQAAGLTELHLTDNSLRGNIPDEILQLSNLRKLYLNYNQLSGTISPKISSLLNLEELFLYNNRLGGQLPASIGLLSHLKRLSLAENSFSGTLPPELNDLTNLEVLSIQREGGTDDATVGIDQGINSDVGAGISGPLPSFDNLKYLKQLYLGSNSLSGNIPYSFLNGIENKGLHIEIDLISNRLTGTVPASLTQFGDASLYLAGNRISGIADGLCGKESWMQGAVAKFQCDALLCPPGTSSSQGRQRDSSSACSPCPSDTTAEYYGSFSCLGEQDQLSGFERSILEKFFRATGGDGWKHKTNWMDSGKSICSWTGISCVDDKESVSSIRLAGNGLRNSVPQDLFLLPNLNSVDFSQNTLLNISFVDMSKASKLAYLQLNDANIQSLSGLELLNGLKLLHIPNNKFLGVDFAYVVTSLTNLESLDASGNDMRLLPAFSSQRNLTYLACADCGLAGTIPPSLTALTTLRHLDLMGNSLEGTLPGAISSLSSLSYLNLADQVSFGGPGLEGSLPDFAGMTQLQGLYLQRNNFSSIPATFLSDVDVEDTVTVDLSFNSIGGLLPKGLSHIPNMNFYVSGNLIAVVPDEICTANWNQPVGSTSGCDHILCAKGSFNALGRETPKLSCEPCTDSGNALYFGSTQCGFGFEKNIVYSLFESLGGRDWTHKDGWQDHDDHCSWYGVECYQGGFRNGFVQKIVLSENNLKGTLDASIWSLVHMKELDLRKNEIDVQFDGIANANSLETLQLSETKVASLRGIALAPYLKYLHMTSCDISGPIPDELFEMTQLRSLYLNYNELTGFIPNVIGELSQLEELYLFHNELNGTIPTEIGLLSSVEILSLGENQFTGTIPTELSSLQELRVLALQREATKEEDLPSLETFFMVVEDVGLTGNVISFNNAPKLRALYLSNNHLGGDLPIDFLFGIDDPTATIICDLSSNILGGAIPATLVRFDDLRLDLTGNVLREIPGAFCSKTEWFDGELAAGCDALVCEPGTWNEYGRRIGAEGCETCNFRGSAMFYGSRTCGPLYPQGMTESYMLQELYASAGGLSWENTDNWLREDVSVCEWFGVSCERINDQDVVTEVSLAGNGLIGLVPSIIFYLPHLKKLNLGRNKVWVKFDDIQYSVLEELSLDETNLSSLEGISKASSLKTLRLQKTQLTGLPIPDELYNLVNLTVLELSECGLTSSLSSDIGKLENLVTLLLDRNELSGQIPSNIGGLSKLQDLFLSDNNFFGTLPPALNQLVSLKSLFLDSFKHKGAGVSGPLLSFSNMPKLRALHLGSNSLTGSIPSLLMSGVDNFNEPVEIDLASNHLTGSLPSELSAFSNLNLDVTDNSISSIDDSLCKKSSWQEEAVGQFSCSAILCPPMTWNSDGRQSSADTPCVQCSGVSVSKYMGQTSCLNDEKAKERQILELLYNATGGRNWKNSNGWLDGNKDYCAWYGITCVDGTVDSISLGSNNLQGRAPADLFHLWNLRVLWLYSNPIEFRFDGIRKASKLEDLRLDSTGLGSLDGLGDALGLTQIDVRFNQLEGELPDLSDLRDLKSFSCSGNKLTGSLPTFATNTKLVSLRAGGNAFTGFLPAFDKHPSLVTLDLSDNEISGPIPENILAAADTSAAIMLDLSSCMLTGAVPSSLSRFADLTLYLRDNNIEAIPAELCAMSDWNQGDVGLGGCDGILCPPQTFAPVTGRASRSGSKCEACDQARHFGSTTCGANSDSSAASSSPFALWGFLASTTITLIVCNLL